MATDFYMVLGVPANASRDEIKAAYRRRVKELHPDHYGPDTGPFLEVQEAYSTLTDAGRRERFDQRQLRPKPGVRAGKTRARNPEAEPLRDPALRRGIQPAVSRDFHVDPEAARFTPSFDELFDRLFSNFTLSTRPKAERMESLTVEVVLSPEEAMRGGAARILLPGRARCTACGGHGAVGFYECWECEGAGGVTREFPVDVAYPAGVATEHVVQVPLNRFGIGNFYLTVWFRVD